MRRHLRKAELGKWDSSYPDASPKRPVKVNYPWFTDHSGKPYFAKPDPRVFDPDLVTPELQHHAMGLWEGYQTMRLTKLPGEYGLSRTGLPFEKYAVIYQKQADLSTPDMDELWHYMMGVRWVTSTAYKSWRDLLKRNELAGWRTPEWYTSQRSPRVARTRRRKASEGIGDYDQGWFETWIEPEEVEQFYKENWSPTFEPHRWALEAMQKFGGDEEEFEDQEEEDFYFELFFNLAKKVDAEERQRRAAMNEDQVCDECKRPMEDLEAGDVPPGEEFVCDECAGHKPSPAAQAYEDRMWKRHMRSTRKSPQYPRRRGSSRRKAEIENIDIGPTTMRDEVYDLVDQAMTAVANLRIEGFRLGRYDIVYDGAGWQISDFQTGQEIDWYPDKAKTTYDMVDDWNNDVWTNKNKTPYGF